MENTQTKYIVKQLTNSYLNLFQYITMNYTLLITEQFNKTL